MYDDIYDLHSRLYGITYKYELMRCDDSKFHMALLSTDNKYKLIAMEFGTVDNLGDNQFRYT